jgi:Zn finger protein HypA/HybF involved in hydrogenase expression
MTTADMRCHGCSHEWEYQGLASDSAYCPKCSTLNQIPYHVAGNVDYGPLYTPHAEGGL